MTHAHRTRLLPAALLSFLLVLPATALARGGIGTEVWIGSGISWPDYRDDPMACARGGLGLVFARHLGLGISAQGDRDRFHYFGDATVILPALGLLEPYGRFQVGRRDDRDDTAMGWVVGLRGGEVVRLYLEVNQIFEPESDIGLTIGISF